MKKLMSLGGNYFQMTAVKTAKRLGYYVIDVDYLPNNPAHAYADEYVNVSTIDKDAVLKVAMEKKIDGIISYASDVSAPTAAYVAEKMGLPTNPYESVKILTNKELFRNFMKKHGFKIPDGKSFASFGMAYEYLRQIELPAIIKPVDASGSKGVTKITSLNQFGDAYQEAIQFSISGKVIIEKFIEKSGYQIDGDGFLLDGRIIFFGVMDQHNDLSCAPYTPIGLSCPTIQEKSIQKKARLEIQKIFDLLHMKIGAFNFEYIVDSEGNIYILEIGPRNGGNYITDTIKVATGIDLSEYTVKSALGESCDDLTDPAHWGNATSYIVHSREDGIFESIEIDELIQGKIEKQVMFVNKGDYVKKFSNAGEGIGAMVIRFNDREEMLYMIDHMNEYVNIELKK